MVIQFKSSKDIDIHQIEQLYNDAKWYAYTNELENLHQALLNSLDVISAWEGNQLVGLIRVVGDGHTIIYIQDILVLNDYQNQGIVTLLMHQVLNKYDNVRQKVLLTIEAPMVRYLYEKCGFKSCNQGSEVAFTINHYTKNI